MLQAPDESIDRVQSLEGLPSPAPSVFPPSPLRVLHLVVTLGDSDAWLKRHCLQVGHEDVAICSYSTAALEVPTRVTLFEGDGTGRGFRRALARAIDSRDHDIVHAHAPRTGFALLMHALSHRRRMSNAVLSVPNTRSSVSMRSQALLVSLFGTFPTIVFGSRSALESYPRWMRDLRGGNVAIVPKVVDIDRIDNAIHGIDGPDPTFRVVVGRLGRKDPCAPLRAFRLACVAGDELRYVGDGEHRARVLREAERLGLGSRVEFTGAVDRDEMYRQMARSSVFVAISRGEGPSIAALEAMTCGRPVVLSDIPLHREIAAGSDAVRLVAPADVLGIAREIRRLREMSPDERAEIGRKCRAIVDERFGIAAMNQSYQRVYERIISRAGGGDSMSGGRSRELQARGAGRRGWRHGRSHP